MIPRIGLKFMVDHGLGVHPSVNKTDYGVVYYDELSRDWAVRLFHKGSYMLEAWETDMFDTSLLVEI